MIRRFWNCIVLLLEKFVVNIYEILRDSVLFWRTLLSCAFVSIVSISQSDLSNYNTVESEGEAFPKAFRLWRAAFSVARVTAVFSPLIA